ncbi:sensor histidine kinase [Actinorugispora endophytica]|uniref:histidine kinase n=1 Tax=Actinorugispora endophytica TaxID=1605990 RepID=A0A4R6V5L7_9ACTN|nr:histidine kinase [Actinorugispora endophytica]TDQ54178.1 histidine kinase [Actinorugispora endophytica]
MNEQKTPPRPRRSPRDWAVDSALFLAAAGFGLVLAATRLETHPLPPPWLFTLDQATGALGCAALWLRRRRPTETAVALVAVSAFSEMVAGAMLVGLFTVAVHRPPRTTAAVFGLSLLSASCYVVLRPEPDAGPVLLLLFGSALQGAAVGWGLFVHHRRRLALSLLGRAESEARLRAERARNQVREEIAREIHDVLGHRLSLLSVHAGALEYRPDAPPEDVARAAGVIRENAHRALQDLREVLGVLRAPVGELPQPTLADVRRLTEESERAGTRVELEEDVTGTVPDRVGRTAYRIVQEGLTNARKHAPGAPVRVRVAGEAGRGLTVEVRNTAPAAAPAPDARFGQGLVGLAERVALAEGRLEHGPTPSGGWRLAAWLAWSP